MLEFCEEKYECRRKLVLNYLGEQFDPANCNKMCDNCKKDLKIFKMNMTTETKKIIEIFEDL